MSYYQSLGFHKEPFSTSPDPSFFYRSKTHRTALNQLEIAIRLKRGLSIVLGDVGTGKTTLSRTLLNAFNSDESFEFYLIFDPSFQSEYQFIVHLSNLFKINPVRKKSIDFKRAIQDFLFEKHFSENKTIILIIDECQKMSSPMLEILRILLNYETNENKLLQLVLLSQLELIPKIIKTVNFTDRIYFKHILKPLVPEEVKEMIEFRLYQAGYHHTQPLFSDDAIQIVAQYSEGLLRRINHICHKAMLKMIMCDMTIIDRSIVEQTIADEEILVHAG
ncbi:MAG: AAA family ATPase [Chlamydiota bacterium]|nr:AAA family ATPase [Chlamydiota bacterium]